MEWGLKVILAAVALKTTWNSIFPGREGTWQWNKDARPPLPAWYISPRISTGGLPFPRLVSSPEVPFVGGILDVVANVVEHPMSRGAVAGIKHLEEVHCGMDGFLLPSSAPPGQLSH